MSEGRLIDQIRKATERRTFVLTDANLKFLNKIKKRLQPKSMVPITQSQIINDLILYAQQAGYEKSLDA